MLYVKTTHKIPLVKCEKGTPKGDSEGTVDVCVMVGSGVMVNVLQGPNTMSVSSPSWTVVQWSKDRLWQNVRKEHDKLTEGTKQYTESLCYRFD
jgi:hypothetical protein